ncbi:hypothetical protein L202_03883 [Cryptococcus amylolentus CBS 6039]|uniref:Uncharacterized protein n=1 Tax=Cryptococcus amylolentus CBS 6039 TaxID=1295533 RepID=A0A1E3HUM0_9TREE|nr:hypothetical protein L202_03883 [Cryptococcus amylolentus CBS 6039]ODN80022.1 hypothetical protein L202_03883 [Cryptococcus amylolentus CBS 6039]
MSYPDETLTDTPDQFSADDEALFDIVFEAVDPTFSGYWDRMTIEQIRDMPDDEFGRRLREWQELTEASGLDDGSIAMDSGSRAFWDGLTIDELQNMSDDEFGRRLRGRQELTEAGGLGDGSIAMDSGSRAFLEKPLDELTEASSGSKAIEPKFIRWVKADLITKPPATFNL